MKGIYNNVNFKQFSKLFKALKWDWKLLTCQKDVAIEDLYQTMKIKELLLIVDNNCTMWFSNESI